MPAEPRRRWLRWSIVAVVVLVSLYACLRVLALWRVGRLGIYRGEEVEHAADPAAGYHWPFRYYVPESAGAGPVRIWLKPNNSGTHSDDPAVHDEYAAQLLAASRREAEALGAVVVVPSFHRPRSDWRLYTHALDLDTLRDDGPLGRLDLQLLAMAEVVRRELGDRGFTVCRKAFIDGFSASGMFASRFVLAHPETIAAAAIGAPGGWPTVPVDVLDGQPLPFPIGVADFREVFGREYPAALVERIPLLFYLGADDDNDAARGVDAFGEGQADDIHRRFGATPIARWEHARALYAGHDALFRVYPDLGHETPRSVRDDVVAFLRAHDDRRDCE